MTDNRRRGFEVMQGDKVKAIITVSTRSHVKMIRATFTRDLGGPGAPKSYVRVSGPVKEVSIGNAGRTNTMEEVIDTSVLQPAQCGEHLLDQLEVLTASNRWLPVTDYPPVYLDIKAEPFDETPSYADISFYDFHEPYSPTGAE